MLLRARTALFRITTATKRASVAAAHGLETRLVAEMLMSAVVKEVPLPPTIPILEDAKTPSH